MRIERLQIFASGHVQGVGFRASAQSYSQELGISGFAQNLPDGRVMLEAQGDTIALEQFCQYLKQIPPSTEAELEIMTLPVDPNDKTFLIRT